MKFILPALNSLTKWYDNLLRNVSNLFTFIGKTVAETEIKSSTCIFISYYFPPIQSVGVIRNFHLAHLFDKIFNELHILTTSNQQILPKEEVDLSSFKSIALINTIDYRTIIQHFYTKNKNTHYPESVKQNKIIQWLIKANESLPFNLFVGEGGLLYLIDGYSKAKKLINKSSGKTFVVTSFRPTANVLIGFLLKINYPHIIWINSFQDAPYDTSRNNLILLRFQQYCWKKILKFSSLNISTTKTVNFELSKYTSSVTNIFNGVDFRTNKSKNLDLFTISYTGSLFKNLRDPSMLFEAISILISENKIDYKKIKVNYIGKDNIHWMQFALPFKNILQVMHVNKNSSKKHALELQEKSHINLLLSWMELPAKLYEYIGAGSYIISLVKGVENSDLSNMLETLHIGSVYHYGKTEDLEKLKNDILKLYSLWINGVYEPPNIPSQLKNALSWERKQSELSKLLVDLL